MPGFRVLLLCLGTVLFLGAGMTALIHVAEPVPGMHCFAMRQSGAGVPVRACPEVRYVRHTGIAIGMAVAAVVLLVGSRLKLRRV